MKQLQESVRKQYDEWTKTPPNVVQRGLGWVFTPVEFILKPFIKRAAPLLEGVLSGINNFISKAIKDWSGDIQDITEMSENEFLEWFNKADSNAKNWKTGGIAALTVEGAGTGLGGFAFLAADLPASFGLIIAFANKIALTYQLNITDEDIQIEILKAIAAGSETTVEGKLSSTSTLKAVSNLISKQTWKSMENAPAKSLPKLIVTTRAFLSKMGVNITKRKAAQLIPIISAATGGVINGNWASDALEAVRQYSRKCVVESYYEKK